MARLRYEDDWIEDLISNRGARANIPHKRHRQDCCLLENYEQFSAGELSAHRQAALMGIKYQGGRS